MSGLHFDVTGNNENFLRKLEETKRGVSEAAKFMESQGKKMDSTLHSVSFGDTLKKQIYEGSQSVNGLTAQIIKQRAVIKDIEQDVRNLGEAYKRAGAGTPKGNALFADFKSAKSALREEKAALFDLQTQQAQARLSVRKLKDEYSLYQKEGRNVVDSNNNMSLSFKKTLAAIGGVAALKQLGSEIVKIRGEFQAMQTAIETLVGKDMAANLIPQIKELAKVSPLTLSDMVGAEKMMLGFNIKAEDTIRYLQALGDISMGNSQKFNSLTLAFSQMSATGKLMGQDLNQMINAGFNPLQTISEKTGKSIATLKEEMSKGAISTEMVQKAFIDATSEGGRFFGMSENASKTINGQLSMMQDALDEVFNEIGTKGEGAIMSGIQATTSLIQNYETVGKILTGLIATFGVYKAATVAYYAITKTYGIYDIATKELQFAATMKNIVATKVLTVQQALLNKTMLSNPYILVTTLVVGAAAAMWAFHDSTTAAEKAQSKFNDELDKFKQKEEERKQKIECLIRTIQDETETEFAKVKAYEELQRLSPTLTDAYKREELAVASLADTNKELNKVRDVESYDNIIANIDKYSRCVKELQSISGGWSSSTKSTSHLQMEYPNTNVSNARELAIEDLKKWQEALDEYKRLKKEAEENAKPVKVKLLEAQDNREQILQEFLSAKMTLEEEQRKIQESGFGVIPIDVQIRFDNAKAQLASIDKTIASLMQGNTTQTYKEAYNTAQREWKAAQKALEESKKKSKADYDKAKKDLDEKEKVYKDLGGIIGSSLTKQESAAEKLREQQEKYNLLLDKQALDRKRQSEDLENQAAQASIDTKADGFNKVQAQRELDNKKEIQALERQKEDYIRAYIQAEKEKFDAEEDIKKANDSKHVKKTFNSSSVTVDTSKWDKIIKDTEVKQGLTEWEQRETAMNEYLLKYGTFSQKKEAIDKKYRDAIEKETDLGKKNTIQKEWDEALSSFNFTNLKKNMNWETIFGNLGSLTRKQLQDVKRQLTAFKNSEEFKQTATPENIKIIEDALNNINTVMVDKSGFFGGLGDALNDYEEKVRAVAKAQEELNKALEVGDEAAIEKAQENLNQANSNKQGAQGNVDKSTDQAVGNLNKVAAAMKQLGSADVGLAEVGGAVENLVSILGESKSKIGGIIAAILSILDSIGDKGITDFVTDLVSNVLSSLRDAAIKDIDKTSFGLLDMSFFKGADYSDYNEMIDQYTKMNEIWDELIDKKKEYIKTSYGEEAAKAGKEAEDLVHKSMESYRNLGLERLNAGASTGSHSIGVRQRKSMSDQGWNEAKKVLGSDFNKYEIGDGRMTGLFSLSVEQLEKLKYEAPTFWAKLDGDVSDYLNKIIKGSERIEEIQNQVKEQLTGISFDSFFDNFIDSLYDLKVDAKEISNDIADEMRKGLIKAFVVDNYRDEMKKWYDKWADAMKDGTISSEEQKALDDMKDSIVTGATESAKLINEQFSYLNDESTSQNSTQKGFETMSQDTGTELNGRFTALQVSNEEIKNSMLSMLSGVNLISTSTTANGITLTEIKNLAMSSNNYLEDIAGFQKKIVNDFGRKLDSIDGGIKQFNGKH